MCCVIVSDEQYINAYIHNSNHSLFQARVVSCRLMVVVQFGSVFTDMESKGSNDIST